MKTYVLIVSKCFPKTHKRAGESTEFIDKIACSLYCPGDCAGCHLNSETFKKIHTIRANYELWAKRVSEVQKGEAIISIRYWSGKPYNSMQIEIYQLDKDSEIGVQELRWLTSCTAQIRDNYNVVTDVQLASNDGLSINDFKDWFKTYDLSKPMAIIHFTNFRY